MFTSSSPKSQSHNKIYKFIIHFLCFPGGLFRFGMCRTENTRIATPFEADPSAARPNAGLVQVARHTQALQHRLSFDPGSALLAPNATSPARVAGAGGGFAGRWRKMGGGYRYIT